MIREARLSDLYEIVDLGWNFNNENTCFKVNSKEDIEKSVIEVLNTPLTYKIWVVELSGEIKSMFCARINDSFFTKEKFLEEVVWFSDKSNRLNIENINLINHIEKFANEIGAKYIQMTTLYESNIPLEKFIKFFKRRGYKPVQLQYIKKI